MIRPALLLSLLFVVGFCYVQQSPPAYQPPAAYPPYQQPGYGKDRSTKKADIRCPLPNIVLSITTPQNATLATGMGAEKIVTCYSGRWTGQTSDGKFVEFDTVRCTTPPPVEPPQ
ncbi:unnamed protein product [Heligmosomoides polygyrus]|uniref:Sushi domain-containing protein n=1 Tax=Heligmosomoides polygyrus TaxID=6339 RepID=A0A183G5Z5_HELPZ|nr:unnamed protein product [Heligmosomoides polygyrus]